MNKEYQKLPNEYVNCPVCGEPDMRTEVWFEHGERLQLIHCVNHECFSNGGTSFLLADELNRLRAGRTS